MISIRQDWINRNRIAEDNNEKYSNNNNGTIKPSKHYTKYILKYILICYIPESLWTILIRITRAVKKQSK